MTGNLAQKLDGGNGTLPAQAVSGVSWQLLSVVIQMALSLLIGIILARLLTPEDFGVVGYVMVFVGFSKTLAQVGIAPALVQFSSLTTRHLGIGLILSSFIGLVTFFAIWFLSPILVSRDAVSILRALSFIFILNIPAIISESLLRRYLRFRPIFIADSVSYFVGYGLVSIALGLSHIGVWSLVLGILVQNALRTVLLTAMSPYRVSMKFSASDTASIARFGAGMTLARLANYGANNGDYFITGTFLGSQALGLYQRAFQLVTNSILGLTGVLTSVLFPAFARMQDDVGRSRRMYLLSVRLTSLVAFPAAALVAASSREIILVLYGDQWVGATTSLRVLSLNALFISILTLGDALARGRGLVFHQFRRHSVYAVMVLVFAFLGRTFDIEGVSIGVTLASFIMYLLMAQLSIAVVEATWRDFFAAQWPGFWASSVIGICVYALGAAMEVRLGTAAAVLVFKWALAAALGMLVLLFLPLSLRQEITRLATAIISSKLPGNRAFARGISRVFRTKEHVA